MGIIKDTFEEQVFFNTVLIENLTCGEFGTGFLISKQIDEKSQKILLFSNKHVFWGRKEKDNPNTLAQLQITFHKKEQNGEYKLGSTIKINFGLSRKQDGYFDHPHPSIDVACVNISGAYTKFPIENRSINVDGFSDYQMSSLFVGQKIIFIGYPKGFFDLKHFLPVARFGTIASIPSIDFNGEKQILIDAPVYPGSSGSPVFFQQPNGQYKLLGIISSAPIRELEYLDMNDSKETNKKDRVPVQLIGLGMLFKLETIKEVFDAV